MFSCFYTKAVTVISEHVFLLMVKKIMVMFFFI